MHVPDKNFILLKHSDSTIAKTYVDCHGETLRNRDNQNNHSKRKILHQLLYEHCAAKIIIDPCLNDLYPNPGTKDDNRKQTTQVSETLRKVT